MRLDKFIQLRRQCGKSAARTLIAQGKVSINGATCCDNLTEVSRFDTIYCANELIQQNEAHYLMLNKPAGYLSATKDSEHPTVMELINSPVTLHIAGRLDRATTGLLLLTNDGQWSRALTDPAFKDPTTDSTYLGVPKVYMVETEHPISDEAISQFEKGIYFAYEDITTQPAQLEILSPHRCSLTIYEGKYHQIKLLFTYWVRSQEHLLAA